MASIRDKNEKAAKQLLKNGSASMKDILALSFGEWPPKGLDINPAATLAQRVFPQAAFLRAPITSQREKSVLLTTLKVCVIS